VTGNESLTQDMPAAKGDMVLAGRETTERPKGVWPYFHHIGIQTSNLENSLSWYAAFLGTQPAWSLASFSPLTRQRLPGIRRLVEIAVGDLRLHLFERPGGPARPPGDSVAQFQHVCLRVDSARDLTVLRDRWIRLFESGDYTFAVAEPPTEVVCDDDGVQSFYAYDVNGLEFEFTWPADGER